VVTYESSQAQVPACERVVQGRRREELGKFLKVRRAQLSPADFGLPGGSRRRTPGLRREELALLAGVGVTWYTWLEQGREIVDSLDPLPATLTNGRFDILQSNDASEDLFWEWHEMPCIHKNTLWCCVTEPSAREKFPQYEQEVPYLVARLRAGYARHVGDPDWEEDIRRLSGLSREFAGLWARHEVAGPEPRVRTFLHPQAGPVTFTVTELEIPVLPEARLTVYTPADEQTRARLPFTRRAR
jgi:transcription regulator MmyB-like protein